MQIKSMRSNPVELLESPLSEAPEALNAVDVIHSDNEFVVGVNHINGIESFWSFAKRRLQKFNGIAPHTFYLHLKECEWRFNHRNDNIYLQLLKLLRTQPL